MKPNQVWEHKYTGARYEIITVTNTAAIRQGWWVQVVYKDERNNVWSRPIKEFRNKNRLVKV